MTNSRRWWLSKIILTAILTTTILPGVVQKANAQTPTKVRYEEVIRRYPHTETACKARNRLADIHALSLEKRTYSRIDENARRVLSEIGLNLSSCEPVFEILMNADAIDFENDTAIFVPLRREYIEECLDGVSRIFPGARFIHIIRDGRDGAVSGWHHIYRDSPEWARTNYPTFSHYAGAYASAWAAYVEQGCSFGQLSCLCHSGW